MTLNRMTALVKKFFTYLLRNKPTSRKVRTGSKKRAKASKARSKKSARASKKKERKR